MGESREASHNQPHQEDRRRAAITENARGCLPDRVSPAAEEGKNAH